MTPVGQLVPTIYVLCNYSMHNECDYIGTCISHVHGGSSGSLAASRVDAPLAAYIPEFISNVLSLPAEPQLVCYAYHIAGKFGNLAISAKMPYFQIWQILILAI